MGMVNFSGGIMSAGIPVLGSQAIMSQGDSYFLDPLNGSDGNNGKRIDKAFKTLAAAYTALTAGQNDVLYYLSGSTSLSMAATLDWAKSYTHLIGIGAPSHDSQRTRIFHSANFSPMITVSGSGCRFENLYFSYGDGGADNHILMTVTGSRNYFGNIHFSAMSHQTEADDADSIAVFLNGTESNLFDHCNFGNQNVTRGDANTLISLDGTTKRNKFANCLFQAQTDAATPTLVRSEDSAAIDQLGCWFYECLFWVQGTAIDQAFDLHALGANRQIAITGASTMFVGCTDVADATGDQQIFCPNPTSTSNIILLATSPTAA